MRTPSGLVIAALALAGCTQKSSWSATETVNGNDVSLSVRTAGDDSVVSLDAPFAMGNVKLPALDSGQHVDLDGIKLAADTRVRNMDVHGKDKGGEVRIGFSNPRPPAALIAYYRQAAQQAGYHAIRSGTASLDAHKDDADFALAVRPEGAGSGGTITVTKRD
ncbi:hypothetical protein [uncultured Sphingomonas sp.]|uniref:hypothetical protein n=1 Tax=uncultured Sphingomonas sp. TaxID=158754 RepID=UPI0025F215FE|nr:hypothetical protein [uncultured Sphingomonas sp.]